MQKFFAFKCRSKSMLKIGEALDLRMGRKLVDVGGVVDLLRKK